MDLLDKNGWKIHTFKSPRLFNIIFEVYDLQGDGFVLICLALFYRTLKIVIPFNGERFKFRCSLRLLRSKLK